MIITNHLKHYSCPILTHRGTCLFELGTKRSYCRRPTKRRIAAVAPAVPWVTTTTIRSDDTHWIRFRLGLRSVWNRTSGSPGLAPARSRRKRRNTAGRPAVAIVETTWTWSGVRPKNVGTYVWTQRRWRAYGSKGDGHTGVGANGQVEYLWTCIRVLDISTARMICNGTCRRWVMIVDCGRLSRDWRLYIINIIGVVLPCRRE